MAANNGTPLRVESEDQAWAKLADLVSGRDTVPDDVLLEFRKWPTITITVDRGQSIITPSMMRGFIGLQDSVYRAHTLIRYDRDDLRALSDEERDALEFEVRVSKGSSQYDAQLSSVLEKIGLAAVDAMDPYHLTIAILGLGAITGGVLGWKWYLQHRTDIRKEEIRSDKDKEFLNTLSFISKEETKRLKVFDRAVRRVPVLDDIREYAEQGKDSLLGSLRNYSSSKINGIGISGDVADEITKSARRASEEITLSGTFSVLRVDTTSPDGFRVKLRDVNTGEQVTAGIGDALANEQQGIDLRKAEWSKKPVDCVIAARRIGDDYRDAVIKTTKIRE